MMIIDAHCHAGRGDGLTGPWDTEAPLRKFLAWSEDAGITHINLFAAFHSDYRQANRAIARIVQGNPGRFFGFAFVHAAADRGRIATLVEEAVGRHGFCGIKVHRHDARITREICEVARRYRLPVLYDVVGEISAVELIATQYPDVNFIIPHLGSFADDWRAQMAFVPMLGRHANVYADTSGVRRFDLLEMALAYGGPEKLLFGSDGPWLHPAVELEKVFALPVAEPARQLILADNFLRLTAPARKGRRAGVLGRVPLPVQRPAPPADAEFRDPWLPALR